MAIVPHVGVPDGDTGWCDDCERPLKHPIHIADPATTRLLPDVDTNEARVGMHHPPTSVRAAADALPRTGTIKRAIFAIVANRPGGATDDELEVALNRTHQSVSAARNSLAADGWVEPLLVDDEPVTRRTRSGNAATVWTPTAEARRQVAGSVA